MTDAETLPSDDVAEQKSPLRLIAPAGAVCVDGSCSIEPTAGAGPR
jgi:hypothetical protein